ncbi:MAG TPA: tRNA (N6-isopentenyl adenosine(37)-C2)-methylthiotransferase MiaB [Firmicutes bacterium]|nr:tRNA (N6-isopentenyl adenosine(37)-C2)-methylthiotransferase MiaB [Bacillota bacterium]
MKLENCQQQKYFLSTFGCQMNVHDSEKTAGILEKIGYSKAATVEEADLILLNTCCVRENAENRLYGHLGNLKPLKTKNPELIIGVGGCMAQLPSVREKIAESYPYVDFLFGAYNLHRLPELIAKIKETGSRILQLSQEEEIVEDLPVVREDPYRAWVTVIYGCNNFCSYCIVPYVRGREKSRRPEKIIAEIQGLASKGVKEITLLGQNVNSYGLDFPEDERMDFADLLAAANRIKGITRIRFQTSHPKDLSDKLIIQMMAAEHVCEHLHLPVQAGSNKILEAMNRKYTREYYLNLVEKLRAKIPNIALTTDLIVGFPGEEEDDFQDTLNLVKEVEFDAAFTFAYSPRVGTKAAEMKTQVPEEVKMDRLYRLIEVVNQQAKAANQRLEGSSETILVEGPSAKKQEIFAGRTCSNKLVLFPPKRPSVELVGKEIKVQIEKGLTYTLRGKEID